MYKYEKKLNYPINIKNKDLKMAKYIITQLGGANGELGAALRYFCQKFSMPDEKGKALLNDIACEVLDYFDKRGISHFLIIDFLLLVYLFLLLQHHITFYTPLRLGKAPVSVLPVYSYSRFSHLNSPSILVISIKAFGFAQMYFPFSK